MKEFKGTPGPWLARMDAGIDVITDNDKAFGICDIGFPNQLKEADYPAEEAKFNSLLIAASPALLSALQQLTDYIKSGVTHYDKKTALLKLSDSAINKALGL